MISIKNVQKSFGDHKVLQDINLEIKQSQIFALIGPSGAGKSTLIRAINALEPINDGEIVVDGIPIHNKKQILMQQELKLALFFNPLTCIRS